MPKYTVVTQLHLKNNDDLISYFEEVRSLYGSAKRKTFHCLKKTNQFNKSEQNKKLQNEFNITKRSANSIINDAESTFKALKELKKYELSQLNSKIEYFEKELIPKLEKKRNENSRKLIIKQTDSLVLKQRNLRRKIVSKKNRLNYMKQKAANLEKQISNNDYRLCFGTKYLLNRDINKFKEKRDSVLNFVGSKDETCDNQIFQLTYNKKNNQFDIKVRKDYLGYKKAKDKYVYGQCYFSNYKKEIIHILENKTGPLSFKIIKRNGKYYLHCTFEIKEDIITCSNFGAIGIDFNKGFVSLSEVNQYGHLLSIGKLNYRFKQGNKTITDLEYIANEVCKQAILNKKVICIENLDFRKTKSKTEKGQGKKYNDMIHSLSYRRFIKIMENTANRYGVELIKVNPAWTSWIGNKLYCESIKLNIHTAASFVIARRGMGIKDKVA